MTIEEQNKVEVNIAVKVGDLNIILSALGEQPHSAVDHIIQSLKFQGTTQLREVINPSKEDKDDTEDEK